MNFKQCLLYRYKDCAYDEDDRPLDKERLTGEHGHNPIGVYTCWLPAEFAKVGKVVDLKRGDGSWTTRWTVVEVYTTMSEEYVKEHERDYKHQAEASDKLTPNRGLVIK